MRASAPRAVRGLISHAQLQPCTRCIDDRLLGITPSACRQVWKDALKADSALQERFYDSTVEKVSFFCFGVECRISDTRSRRSLHFSVSPCLPQYALQEVEALSLQQMLDFGRAALFDSSNILASARHVQKEV